MTSMPGLPQFRYLRAAALVLCLVCVFAEQAWGQDAYQKYYQSMKARQAQLDELLTSPGSCLGEGLNGLLKINYNCSAQAKALAEAENRDRQALDKLMAHQLGLTPEQVGQQRAQMNLGRYLKGVQRQVRISPTKTQWWDGYPPDPRKNLPIRVLALKAARIYARPDSSSAVVRDNIQQYEAFGVVDSARDSNGNIWYNVTEDYVPRVKPPRWSPRLLGWISAKDSIPWRRALVMQFSNPLNRPPSLFFRDKETLLNLALEDSSARNSRLQQIRSQLNSGAGANDGIIAVEPRVGARQQNVIMYPILDFYPAVGQKDLRIDGMFSRLLEVAARTRTGANEGVGNQNIPIDIMFVIDTTGSMQPYIDAVLGATKDFVSTIGDKNIRFALIAYRDKNPAFHYVTKAFTHKPQTAKEFVQTLGGVKAQYPVVRGDDIPECVFEGVNAALQSDQWRKNAIKIIFLVGDAPGRNEDHLNTTVLRAMANTRKIGIYAFHIKDSAVSGGYDYQAEKQFRALSSTYQGAYGTSRQTSHFMSIEARSVDLRKVFLERFNEAKKALEAVHHYTPGAKLPPAPPHSLSDLIFQQAALLLPPTSIPKKEITGWVCDKVLSDPGKEALVPEILLTEPELEELTERVRELKNIGDAALRGQGGTTLDFFDLVQKNTRFTMVNPHAVNFRDAFSVPLGIDQLPYKSDIMAATRDEFENMDRVQDFVRSMTNKLLYYEDLERKRGDPMVWKKLSRGASERDSVVAVPLNELP